MTPTSKASSATTDTPDTPDTPAPVEPSVTPDTHAEPGPDTPGDEPGELERLRAENERLRAANDKADRAAADRAAADEAAANTTEIRLVIVGAGPLGQTKNRKLQVPVTGDGYDRREVDKAIASAFEDGAANVEEINGVSNVIHHPDTFAAVG